MFFQGASTLNLDAKGRLAIPAKYRGGLAEESASRLVVTLCPLKGSHCLWLYPESVWQGIAQTVSRLPSLDPHAVKLQRLLLGTASDSEMDGQGRITLPEMLRTKVGLEKRVTLSGMGNKLEIWDETVWTNMFGSLVEDAAGGDGQLLDAMQSLSL